MKLAIFSGTTRRNSALKIEQGLNGIGSDLESKKLLYEDCVVSIIDGQLDVRLASDDSEMSVFDAVYLHGASNETLRYLIAQYCMAHEMACVNTESRHTQYIDKLAQYYRFAEAGVPIPTTYGGYKDALMKLCECGNVEFPVVVKAANGSNGKDNFICHSVADFEQCSADQLYVLQPFIDNTHDYRVIVAGDEVIYAYKRARVDTSTHLNNVSAGGQRDMTITLPEEYAAIAIKASKAVEREISGVDILVSLDERPYVLESNFNFGLPKLETIDRAFFQKLHAYIESLAKKSKD